MARSKSSRRWLKEHFDDPYVKQAQQQGLRSRAAFKLTELQDRFKLIKPGMTLVDLGAAPGGWSQVAVGWIGRKGRIIALDLLEMAPLDQVTLIQGDFTEAEALTALEAELDSDPVHLVLSDMAPNISGMEAIDQPKAMYLVELALDFCRQWLRSGGSLIAKGFHGEGFDAWLTEVRSEFAKVQVVKPDASRPRSREVYIVATRFRGAGR